MVRLRIESWRWAGVPFLIRAGKNLPVTRTEVLVTLRQPPLTNLAPGDTNYLRFRLSSEISINLGARVKRPGAAMVSVPVELSAVEDAKGDELDAYGRRLGDAMHGDVLLFVHQDAVEATWAIVEPILGNVATLYEYAPHTWGPAEADVIFLVSGEDKALALKVVPESHGEPEQLPAQLIHRAHGSSLWLVDRAAASPLQTGYIRMPISGGEAHPPRLHLN